ncbi:MAG: HAD family hydrolase, partial [Pseudomonadota bacterium]
MQAVVRAVVFDLDGTLVESAPDLHAAAVRMLAGLGRPALDLATVTGFVGNGVGKLVERCLVATGGEDGLQAEALAAFHRHYAAAPTALTRPYEGVADALAALAAAGLPLGVCTNKPEAMARRVLTDLDLAAPFGAVVGG